MKKVVLFRYGESAWNKENCFMDWTDVGLIEKRVAETEKTRKILEECGFNFDKAYISYLKRTMRTLNCALDKMNLGWIPVERSWRLSEKRCGELQGLNKTKTAEKYGEEQVLAWRRSYNIAPHPLSEGDLRNPRFDYRYHGVSDTGLSCTESSRDTIERIIPYQESGIFPSLKTTHTLLVIAHDNSLRGIIKHLKNISDEDIVKLDLPTAVPYVFELGESLNAANDYFLRNPEETERLTEAVADQGKKGQKSYTLKKEAMSKVVELLRDRACCHLNHTYETIDKSLIHVPSPDTIDKIWIDSDRNIRVLDSLQTLLGYDRLANTGYVSILPVDQDIEHAAGVSFASSPIYFGPENVVKLTIEGGCNGVASTFGILGSVTRKYAHKIPFIVKLNHNELLSYPNSFDQVLFGTVKRAWSMGVIVVSVTIYFGSEQSRRQPVEATEASEYAHELGMVTILWYHLCDNDFKKGAVDYHIAVDPAGQADRLGVAIRADIAKQKLPTNNGGFKAIGFGKIDERIYTELASKYPIDLCHHQVANGYIGRVGLVNSGGEPHGSSGLRDTVTTAVVNECAGGMGLISGRKVSQKPMNEGMELLDTTQDVYLDSSITIV